MANEHVSTEELVLLIHGELPSEPSEKVRHHLQKCKECQTIYQSLMRTEALLASGSSPEMPEDMAARIKQRLRQLYPLKRGKYWHRNLWKVAAAAALVGYVAVGALLLLHHYHPGESVGPAGIAQTTEGPGGDEYVAAPSEGLMMLRSVEGSPVIVRGDESRPARSGAALAAGDELQTGDTDRVLVELPDKGQIVVNFDSTVRVSEPAEAEPVAATSVELLDGQIWVWSPGDGQPIAVEADLATARIHHGEALVRLSGPRAGAEQRVSGPVEVMAFRGEVNLYDREGDKLVVPAGHSLLVEPAGNTLVPQKQSPLRLVQVSTAWGRRYQHRRMAFLSQADLLVHLDAPRLPLGLRLIPLPDSQEGLRVVAVAADSAAAEAGVREDDILLAIGDHPVATLADVGAGELLLASVAEPSVTIKRSETVQTLPLPSWIVAPSMCEAGGDQLTQIGSAIARSDWERAEARCLSFIHDYPSCGSGWFNLGLLQEYSGRYREAVESQKMATRQSPASPAVLTALGRAYALVGNVTRGVETLRKALSLDPTAERRHLVGRILLLDGQLAGAQEQIAALLDSPAREYQAWGHLLAGYVAIVVDNDMAEAAQCLQSALALDAANLEATHYLASVRRATGDLAESKRLLGTMLAARPDSVRATTLMGAISWEEQNWEAAEMWFERGRGRKVASAVSSFNLGSVAYQRGDYQAAAAHYRNATDEAPYFAQAYTGLGTARQALGEWQEAADQYAAALELDPGEEEAQRRLVALWEEHGRPDKARLIAQHYRVDSP